MDLHSLLRTLRFNWLLLLLSAVVGAASGALLASLATPGFTATAEVFVGMSNGTSTGELAQGSNYAQQQARNFAAVASREIVLGPVVQELGLAASVAELRDQIRVSVPINTSMISIEVTSASPATAAAVANLVAKRLSSAAGRLTPDIEDLSGPPVKLQVVEQAVVPTAPSSPNVPLWVLLGLAAGLAVGLAWMAVREFLVGTARSAEQVELATGLSHLGTISFDRSAPRQPLAITADPFSARAEEYRQLRGSLRFLSPGSGHKAFVITSTNPGEGKSLTAANLAEALAASGQRVCLVEADLRKPTLGQLLDLDDSIGLSTVLAGEASVDEVIQPWGEHGLRVLLAGGLPPNPSELLESQAAEKLLKQVRDDHAVTIIDSPPLNAVADATALSHIFGGVVLVVGAKRVQMRDLRQAVRQLGALGVPVHGYILNAAAGTRRSPYYRHPQEQPARPTSRAGVNGGHQPPDGVPNSQPAAKLAAADYPTAWRR